MSTPPDVGQECPTHQIAVIIPALNEEASIGKVIRDLPATRVIVADNGSTDRTADVARDVGAIVVSAPRRGYGSACLAGIAFLEALPLDEQPKIVAFIDADYSDFPEQLPLIVGPILAGEADFVIGSRMLKSSARQALLPQARFGNKLACFLIRVIFRQRYSDLGPFRAITFEALKQLNMTDKTFGWTVEMQIKAARQNLRIREVAVDYRPRIGESKITGTFSGSIKAGYKILATIFRYAIRA
jgi:glycosyltransferase involved in cell wall biosynthesis